MGLFDDIDPGQLEDFKLRSEANEIALRGLADFCRYLRKMEDVEDREIYDKGIQAFIKGAGSSYFDQINAVGAYDEKNEYDDDLLQFTVTLITLALAEIGALVPDDVFAQVLYNLYGDRFMGDVVRASMRAKGHDTDDIAGVAVSVIKKEDDDES